MLLIPTTDDDRCVQNINDKSSTRNIFGRLFLIKSEINVHHSFFFSLFLYHPSSGHTPEDSNMSDVDTEGQCRGQGQTDINLSKLCVSFCLSIPLSQTFVGRRTASVRRGLPSVRINDKKGRNRTSPAAVRILRDGGDKCTHSCVHSLPS